MPTITDLLFGGGQQMAPLLSMLSASGGGMLPAQGINSPGAGFSPAAVTAASNSPLNPWANSLALANGGGMGGGGAMGGMNWDDLMRMFSMGGMSGMGGMGGNPFARTGAPAGAFSMPGMASPKPLARPMDGGMGNIINRMMQYR